MMNLLYYGYCNNLGTEMAIQVFTEDQLHYIRKGQEKQTILRSVIDTALNNNQFNDNYVISSLPGLGKSFEMEQAIAKLANEPLQILGNGGMNAFYQDMAMAVYLAKGQPLNVVLDDCDMLFEDKNLNVTKKMFDNSRVLKYNKNFRALKGMATEEQFAAMESFSSPTQAGFSIPLNNVTFIILTNRYFPTINQVEEQDAGSKKEQVHTDLYAIRRRTEGETIEMSRNELWGYVANVVLNEKICEKFMPIITLDYKHQMLEWCFTRWAYVTERNLSLVEKMTKDIVRYPNNYKSIWADRYEDKLTKKKLGL